MATGIAGEALDPTLAVEMSDDDWGDWDEEWDDVPPETSEEDDS
ncbi:MAG: hypothetical protein R2697_22000 [Ilumatobacteraceae bacterium]